MLTRFCSNAAACLCTIAAGIMNAGTPPAREAVPARQSDVRLLYKPMLPYSPEIKSCSVVLAALASASRFALST